MGKIENSLELAIDRMSPKTSAAETAGIGFGGPYFAVRVNHHLISQGYLPRFHISYFVALLFILACISVTNR